jgi:putative DNA-invertase from lambdoid prophage Rac
MNGFNELSEAALSAFYGRVSTNKQDASLDAQDERVAAYAKSKRLSLKEELRFTDEDTSGSIPMLKRAGGKLLLNTIELYANSRTPIRHLIVTKIDRLGRDSLDGELVMRRLRELGVIVHIIDLGGDSLSTAGVFGELIIKIIFAIAEWDRKNITQNIRTSMAFKRTKGELCGTVPYGLDAVGTGQTRTNKAGQTKEVRRLEPNLTEQKWIRYMADRRRAGLSYQKIAIELNAQGVPSKTGGRWQCGNVAKVLSSSYTKELLAGKELAA